MSKFHWSPTAGTQKKRVRKTYDEEDFCLWLRRVGRVLAKNMTMADACLGITGSMPKMEIFTKDVLSGIDRGKSIAESLRLAGCDDEAFLSVVQVGEDAGKLPEVFQHYGTLREKRWKLKQKIERALIYPAAVISGCFALILFLMSYTFPSLKQTFDVMNIKKDALSAAIFTVSDFMQIFPWQMWVAMGGAFFLFMLSLTGRRMLRRWLMIFPVFKRLRHNEEWMLWTRMMHLSLCAGLTTAQALENCMNAAPEDTQGRLEDVKKASRAGKSLCEQTVYPWPSIMRTMLKSGEMSGGMEEAFLDASDWYGEEVTAIMEVLDQAIAPITVVIIMIPLGLIVYVFVNMIFSGLYAGMANSSLGR